MGMRYEKPTGHEIKRRTFKGKTDDSKNDNSLTSKYLPSYKYWMKITYPHALQGHTDCYRTKREAEEAYEKAVKRAGTIV